MSICINLERDDNNIEFEDLTELSLTDFLKFLGLHHMVIAY